MPPKNISLEVSKGHIVCIAGPNGTGKTTLVKCIAGIFKPLAGRVTIDGADTREMERKQLASLLGYVPQNIPARFPATVFETVLAGGCAIDQFGVPCLMKPCKSACKAIACC